MNWSASRTGKMRTANTASSTAARTRRPPEHQRHHPELPLAYITKTPATDRIVNTWGESWVLKASGKIPAIPDSGAVVESSLLNLSDLMIGALVALGLFAIGFAVVKWRRHAPAASLVTRPAFALIIGLVLVAGGTVLALQHKLRPGQQGELDRASMADELKLYKLIDTDGQPFADAALNERQDGRQVGAYNYSFGESFVKRLAHLGWGFAPSISALGLKTSFDHDNSPVSVNRTPATAADAFLRGRRRSSADENAGQLLESAGMDIPLRRAPSRCSCRTSTRSTWTRPTWPFGRRLEDQVATRFLALFPRHGRRVQRPELATSRRCKTRPRSTRCRWIRGCRPNRSRTTRTS